MTAARRYAVATRDMSEAVDLILDAAAATFDNTDDPACHGLILALECILSDAERPAADLVADAIATPTGTALGTARIVNPDTGDEVHANVTIVGTPAYARHDETVVWVQVRPSFRPGMEYDLDSFPREWVVR